MSLDARRQTFVQKYVELNNAKQAVMESGYKSKGVYAEQQANKLLKNPEVKAAIAEARAEIKAESRISTEAKREFLWKLAHDCGRVEVTEDIEETVDKKGNTTRIIRVTESVFKPREAIEAIGKLNEMDGDIKTPAKGPGGLGDSNVFTIEQAILSFGNR